jgi:hypothetical protein
MTAWTVFKVRWLLPGQAGAMTLAKLGTIDADDYFAAVEKARGDFAHEADPSLPEDGLLVRAARSAQS